MSLKEIFQQTYPNKKRPNTNHRSRPDGIDGIVIHSMAEYIKTKGHAVDFLQVVGLSAHKLIEPDGTVIETVDPERQAYHAGISEFNGWKHLNKNFVGIEILVEGEYNYGEFLDRIKEEDAFKDEQYHSCAIECALLCIEYDIDLDNIVRHSDVSGADVRPDDPKYDVGSGFNFSYLKDLTGELIHQLTEAN